MRNRWEGIVRPYTKEQVRKLQGSFPEYEKYPYSTYVAEYLWDLLNEDGYVHALGAVTGNQAMQMVKAGLKAIYCSGWQVAADNNDSFNMYPDQSLYAVNSVPSLVRKINNSLRRADQVEYSETGRENSKWMCPIVADAEAGFGGPLNVFELMKQMIMAGAAGVHFEDQLSSAKKCGHMGGKVLVPGSHFIQTLVSARLAADVLNVPTLIIARTDANAARLMTSDIDDDDLPFVKVERIKLQENMAPSLMEYLEKHPVNITTEEGFYCITGGLDMAISRAKRYAPYADLLWCETSEPNLEEAKRFAEEVHKEHPGKLLAYNCSPSFNWKKKLDDATIAKFQRELGAMGYKFQFITLAGFHSLNHGMFSLAKDYNARDMSAFADLQEKEFASQKDGFTAVKHQREVGTGYFDLVSETIGSSLSALKDSTEHEQF